MKKILTIFILFLCISHSAYSFWIWSPKSGKWKNPAYSPKADPKLQLQEGVTFFEEGNIKRALKEFKKLIKAYPDAQDAAEAQYYLGRCYEKLDSPYRAFLEYQKLITTYPNSMRIQETLGLQFSIGESFLEWDPKKVLGVPMTIREEHPGTEIFRTIAETAPYSEYAPKALYNLGTLHVRLKRFDDAKDTFTKLIDDYPESEFVKKAKYQLAFASSQSSLDAPYDQTQTRVARGRLQDFLEKYPDDDAAEKAHGALGALKEKEARQHFEAAEFYLKQGKTESALIYYQIIVNQYPHVSVSERAQKQIKILQGG